MLVYIRYKLAIVLEVSIFKKRPGLKLVRPLKAGLKIREKDTDVFLNSHEDSQKPLTLQVL